MQFYITTALLVYVAQFTFFWLLQSPLFKIVGPSWMPIAHCGTEEGQVEQCLAVSLSQTIDRYYLYRLVSVSPVALKELKFGNFMT